MKESLWLVCSLSVDRFALYTIGMLFTAGDGEKSEGESERRAGSSAPKSELLALLLLGCTSL